MITNYNLEELDLFKVQLILSSLFIGTLLVSMTLTYNEKLKFMNKPPLFTEKQSSDLLVLNRTVSLFIAMGFLYLNVINRKAKENNELNNIRFADMQVSAGVLNLLGAIIVLYVALYDKNTPIISLENPEI